MRCSRGPRGFWSKLWGGRMMKYNSQIHHRRSIRLKRYDYSQAGVYFVTICVQNRECLFGDIANRRMRLNVAGRIVADEWMKSAEIRDRIELDEWVMMPNHFHGIVWVNMGRGTARRAPTQIREPSTPYGHGDAPCTMEMETWMV